MRQARSTKAVRTTSDELMNGDYRDSLHPGLDLQGNGYYSGSESARTDSAALKNSDFPGCVKGKPQAGGPV